MYFNIFLFKIDKNRKMKERNVFKKIKKINKNYNKTNKVKVNFIRKK